VKLREVVADSFTIKGGARIYATTNPNLVTSVATDGVMMHLNNNNNNLSDDSSISLCLQGMEKTRHRCITRESYVSFVFAAILSYGG
jgi:hypothetical protein